jgi:hypothetical protein
MKIHKERDNLEDEVTDERKILQSSLGVQQLQTRLCGSTETTGGLVSRWFHKGFLKAEVAYFLPKKGSAP